MEKDDIYEDVMAIHQACADIQRWVLDAYRRGEFSFDRKNDIAYAAKRISGIVTKTNKPIQTPPKTQAPKSLAQTGP